MRPKPQPIPPIEQRRLPGLSATLPYPRILDACQGCGVRAAFAELRKWQECDELDRETPVLVILCEKCEKRLINPHPRLYKAIDKHRPWAGAMEICLGCRHAVNVACASPLQRTNGGPGLPIHQVPPMQAHLNYGGGRGEFKAFYSAAPTKCEGREAETP